MAAPQTVNFAFSAPGGRDALTHFPIESSIQKSQDGAGPGTLVNVTVDKEDRRSRRLAITAAGRALLGKAFPIWKESHAALDRQLTALSPDKLRTALRALT